MANFTKKKIQTDFALYGKLFAVAPNDRWELVGYRVVDVRERKFYDVSSHLLDGLGFTGLPRRLPSYLEQLLLVPSPNGNLMATEAEHKTGSYMSELPITVAGVKVMFDSLIANGFKSKSGMTEKLGLSLEECKTICDKVMSEMCSFKHLQKSWQQSQSYKALTGEGWHAYRSFDWHNSKHFNWNRDHDYCERQYDCYSIIEDGQCPKFEETKDYATLLSNLYSTRHGVAVKVEMRAVKDEVVIHVDVKTTIV
jgi:hypothetical protein